jgi:hypothetical protein
MSIRTIWIAKLEFERVQSFLFAVSELKSMIGANTLLGEVLRGRLMPDLDGFVQNVRDSREKDAKDLIKAESGGAGEELDADNLPALAVRCGAQIPADGHEKAVALLRGPESDDPLEQGIDRDAPAAAYRCGVLVRDGGHFCAVFPDTQKAERFVAAALQCLARELPGLLVRPKIEPLVFLEEWQEWKDAQAKIDICSRDSIECALRLSNRRPGDAGISPLAVPQFQICQVTGREPAAMDVSRPDGEAAHVSASVHAKETAAARFNRGNSSDILGLLRNPVLAALGLGEKRAATLGINDEHDVFPTEFNRIGKSGYLRVEEATAGP